MISVAFAKPSRKLLSAQMPQMAALMVGLGLIALTWAGFETRLFESVPVWVKPLKFALSLALYYASLALVISRLSPAVQQGWPLRLAAALAIVPGLLEAIYIFLMAGRAQASHFNDSAPIFAALYALMGMGAFMLMVAVGLIGFLVWRDPAARFPAGLRLGIAAGFGVSTLLTLVIGFTLGGNGGHFIGVHLPRSAQLPLLGWSGSVGDLRVPHFFGLHAMQVGPALGWMADRRAAGSAVRWVLGGLALYGLATLALFAQALAGLPLMAL